MSKKGRVGGFLLGALAGVTAGLFLAPKSGKENRKAFKKKVDELLDKAKEIDLNEVRENIEIKVNNLVLELKDLDKEKVLKIAKRKTEDLKKQANELVEYTKEKATPIVNEAAESLRLKAISVTESILKKLEEK